MMLTRFFIGSACLHAAAIGLLTYAWHTDPLVLKAPPLRAALQPSQASSTATTQVTEHHQQQAIKTPAMASSSAPPLLPSATSAVNPATATENERTNHLRAVLRRELESYFLYPPLARQRGWQGTVELTIELSANGELRNLRVLRSSGHAILDEDALKTLTRIGSVPEARLWLAGRGHQLALPVIYRLTEG